MDVPKNEFKKALKAGKPQIGLWSSLSSNYTVEVIAGAGFDWMVLDSEHSPADLENLLGQLQAAAPYPTHPVVRVPWNDMVNMKRVLDVGAQTLLVPYVCNAEEARAAVSAHPLPAGRRARRRRHHARHALRPRQGLRQARARGDLRAGAGRDRRPRSTTSRRSARSKASTACSSARPTCTPRWATPARSPIPKVKPVIDEAIRRIRKAGKAPGILTPNEADARHWLGCGALFVAVGSDVGILARGAEALAAKFKS